MSKKSGAFFVVLFALLALLVTFWLPAFILNLLNNPDGSYLSALLLKHQLKNPMEHTPEFYASYVPAVARRLLFTTTLVVAAGVLLASRWKKDLLAFWNYSATPFNLGVLRILVIGDLILFNPLQPIYALPGLTPETANAIPGYDFVRQLLPPSMAMVQGAVAVYWLLAALALVGLFTRYVLPALLLVSFWVLLGPQFVGKIIHYHYYWLNIAILCVSPCGDALSFDYLLKRKRGKVSDLHTPDIVHGRPFVWLWLIIGAIYFFPGFWKFVIGGMDWALSDNIQLKLLAKIVETGEQPTFALYQYPLLCKLGGLSAIIFEMTFIFAMIFPRTRALYAIGGIGFHEINRHTMQIAFTPLEWLYLSFVNWSKLLGKKNKTAKKSQSIPRWKSTVCAVTFGGLVVTGFLNIDSWPWAVYPTFAAIEQKFVNSIEMRIAVEDSDSKRILLQNDAGLVEIYTTRTKLRAYLNQVMAQPNEGLRKQMLKELFDVWQKHSRVEVKSSVEFWHVMIPLWPLNSEPKPYRLLGTLP